MAQIIQEHNVPMTDGSEYGFPATCLKIFVANGEVWKIVGVGAPSTDYENVNPSCEYTDYTTGQLYVRDNATPNAWIAQT